MLTTIMNNMAVDKFPPDVAHIFTEVPREFLLLVFVLFTKTHTNRPMEKTRVSKRTQLNSIQPPLSLIFTRLRCVRTVSFEMSQACAQSINAAQSMPLKFVSDLIRVSF